MNKQRKDTSFLQKIPINKYRRDEGKKSSLEQSQ